MNVTITTKAKDRLKRFTSDDNQFLRIGVVSGGCSGMTYNAGVDDSLSPSDEVVYEDSDIRIVSDQRSALFLEGLLIDYSDDLIQAGFRITNPKALSSCACGSSFAV